MSKDPNPDAMAADQPRRRRKLSAIMMVDVSGFSRMMGADEERTVGLIEAFQREVRGLVEEFEGRVVGTAGDSAFSEFDSVVNAVRCARRIQEEQSRRTADERVDTRIGIHLGDVIVEDYNVYGDGVNIAARLEPLADPGGICLSEAVYQQVRNKLELPIEEIGLRELKNIEHPIRVYKIPPLHAPVPLVPRSTLPEARSSWLDRLLHPARLIMLVVGLFLLVSPRVLFPTAGVFPTAGAILVGIAVGGLAAGAGGTRMGIGAGVALGGVFTGWSPVTNALFVLAGLLVAATGLSAQRRRPS